MDQRSIDRPGVADAPKPPQTERIERELLSQLARRMQLSAATSFIGYGLQAVLLIGVVSPRLLAIWVAAVALCEACNGIIAYRLGRSVEEPARRARWLALLHLGLLMTSISWGAVMLLPGVSGRLDVQTLQGLCIAVAGIISVHNLAYHRGCLAMFSLGFALPVAWATLLDGFPPQLALAGAALVVMTQIYGWSTRVLTLNVIRTNIVNAQMTAELRRGHDELTELTARLRRLAMLDPLTQCLNRRALMEEMTRERARCERYQSRFGLIMLDLDYFKAINDRHGHGVGDAVLVAASGRLREQLRPTDVLGRWGGEEFMCLLTHASAGAVHEKAESMRRSLERDAMDIAGLVVEVTTSVGVAIYRPGQSLDELIEAVDQALYRAKASGRNRVCS
jgi:diguanylate cyclase (GGDEF)-like protein